MAAMATYSVQLANDAYKNSNIPIRMRMVGAFLVQDTSFVETGFQSELNHLRSADGVPLPSASTFFLAVFFM